MARFVFPLQSLLAHRVRIEQERQGDLAVVGAELAAAQAEQGRPTRPYETPWTTCGPTT